MYVQSAKTITKPGPGTEIVIDALLEVAASIRTPSLLNWAANPVGCALSDKSSDVTEPSLMALDVMVFFLIAFLVTAFLPRSFLPTQPLQLRLVAVWAVAGAAMALSASVAARAQAMEAAIGFVRLFPCRRNRGAGFQERGPAR